MKLRALGGLLFAGVAAASIGACDDSFWNGYSSDTWDPNYDPCARYTTCGACTPVIGCGWCATNDHFGTCRSSPSTCPWSDFNWSWQPNGCSRLNAPNGSGGGTSAQGGFNSPGGGTNFINSTGVPVEAGTPKDGGSSVQVDSSQPVSTPPASSSMPADAACDGSKTQSP
jgi:hypothetical protein